MSNVSKQSVTVVYQVYQRIFATGLKQKSASGGLVELAIQVQTASNQLALAHLEPKSSDLFVSTCFPF